jgi:hypothetical protein
MMFVVCIMGLPHVVNIVDECQADPMLVVDLMFRAFSVDCRTPMATILGLEAGAALCAALTKFPDRNSKLLRLVG